MSAPMARSRSASEDVVTRPRLAASPSPTVALVCVRRLEPAAETLQVGVDRLAVRADRAFERRRGNRQPPAAGDEPEHDRVDHGAALLGQRFHVEEETGLRMLLDRLDEPCAVVAPVGHRHSLDHQIGTGGRCDHQRAVRRDETAGDGAAGFHELARQHDIDVADAGRQRQHRPRRQAPAPAPERSRCNRSWRRCAERRRESTSIARGSRAARRRRRSSP